MSKKNDTNLINVSVIIPNYNYGRYIEECINSVIESEFDHSKVEIVIVDDASTDNSIEVIKNIINSTEVKIKLINKSCNSGLAKSRNEGIKNADGDYLFFLDSDNYIKKDCIQKHYNFLYKNEEYSACYAPIQKFDDLNGDLIGVFSNEIYDYQTLCFGNYIDAMSMIKKTVLKEIGLYDENMPGKGWEDYELWLRMGFNNKKVYFLDGEPLSYYRVHKKSMINTISLSTQDKLANYIKTKFNITELESNNVEKINNINPIYYTSVKIFWASNDGVFSEENSVSTQTALNWAEKKVTLKIDLSEFKIEYLRFDIGEQVGFLNIHSIDITNINSSTILKLDVSDVFSKENIILIKNNDFWEGKTIQISTNNDPQFVVQISSLTNEEICNGCIIDITLSALNINQFNLLNKVLTKPLSFVSEKENLDLKVNNSYLINKIKDIEGEKATILAEKECYKTEKNLLINHLDIQNSIIDKTLNELIVDKNKREEEFTNLKNSLHTINNKFEEIKNEFFLSAEKTHLLHLEKEKEYIEINKTLQNLNLKKDQLEYTLSEIIERNNQLILEHEEKEKRIVESNITIKELLQKVSNLETKLGLELQKSDFLNKENQTSNMALQKTIVENNNLINKQEAYFKNLVEINAEKNNLFLKVEDLINKLSFFQLEANNSKNQLINEIHEKDNANKNIASLKEEIIFLKSRNVLNRLFNKNQ